jgi:hypothetical protein
LTAGSAPTQYETKWEYILGGQSVNLPHSGGGEMMKLFLGILLGALLNCGTAAAQKFDFGSHNPGHVKVSPETRYSDDLGYGFENRLPIAKSLVDLPKFDPAHPDPFDKFDVPAEPKGPAVKPYGN